MAIPYPPFLKALIDRINLMPRVQLLLGSGGFAALVIILHFVLKRKHSPKYVTNLTCVGSEQYDVIVVGGGIRLRLSPLVLAKPWYRNSWMCPSSEVK